MQRFLIPLFVLAVLLSACGGGGAGSDCKEYWDGAVGICLPDRWIVVDRETMRLRGIPEETIAVFRYEESISGQFPAVTVTREVLRTEVSASDYSEAGIRAVTSLPGYTLVDSKEVKVDGEKVKLHVFTAQPVADEPARKFFQISTVSGPQGYTVTAATPLFLEKGLESQIESIVKSAVFKKDEPQAPSEDADGAGD